jgi:hypothetical protein
MDDLLYFNGVDATNGSYLLPAIEAQLFTKSLEGLELDPAEQTELSNWFFKRTRPNMGLKEGSPKDLAQAGWGVIFPSQADPAIRQALAELLAWRQEQASRLHSSYYHEFSGEDGYRPGETKLSWLARQGMGPGPAEPEKVPYYLLIVADPATIPYRFQTQLDVQYATGRIDFDNLEDYARYAHSVVEAEKRTLVRPRRLAFFGVSNPDDPATQLSARELVQPLAEKSAQKYSDWQVDLTSPEQASKERLASLLGGEETPAFLFSASHGTGYPAGHPWQLARQGALLTQEWPGPKQTSGPLPEDFYFSGADLGAEARVFGMLAFFFACYSAGTPQFDEYAQAAFKDSRAQIAPRPFTASLPRKMLTHPRGSALAVVGHVDRAWGYSFYWGKAGQQLGVFESALSLLLQGFPVGAALDPFNIRYAELSSELNLLLEDISFGKRYEARDLAGMWTANNDARNYVVLGDPAVRLMAAPVGAAGDGQPELDSAVALHSPGAALPGNLDTFSPEDVTVYPPAPKPGRLYSVDLDSSYILPGAAEMILGRRDPSSGSYPDIDLSNQGVPSASVSRRHAHLTWDGSQLQLEDLGSTNFTQVNGIKLDPGQKISLKNGDEVRLGKVLLIYLAY